jgi:phosphoribosylformylglycinamidine synthase
VIGEVTSTGRLEVFDGEERVADVPVEALAEEGPVYDRPSARPPWIDKLQRHPAGDDAPADLGKALLALLSSPEIASKRWVWEQYDHMIFLGTLQGPGADAAVIRLPGTETSVAITVDGPGRYCYLDPYGGARLAVAEAARNVACTGAKPLAITNCLNFGNPEKPEVMWQFAEVVRGISDACRALGTPVTGGNVSFYNETNGRPIYPTPVIGMLGALAADTKPVGLAFGADGDQIFALGTTRPDDLGGSDYAKVINGVIAGRPPSLDLDAERRLHTLLQEAAALGLPSSAHDCSGGGIAVALAESAISGATGFTLGGGMSSDHRWLFSESPSRAIVSCPPGKAAELGVLGERHGVELQLLGSVGGDKLDFGEFEISLVGAADAFEGGFVDALSDTIDR